LAKLKNHVIIFKWRQYVLIQKSKTFW